MIKQTLMSGVNMPCGIAPVANGIPAGPRRAPPKLSETEASQLRHGHIRRQKKRGFEEMVKKLLEGAQ